MEQTMETPKEWLARIATSNTSTGADEQFMRGLLDRLGMPYEAITCGLIYFDRKGTIMPLSTVAQKILRYA